MFVCWLNQPAKHREVIGTISHLVVLSCPLMEHGGQLSTQTVVGRCMGRRSQEKEGSEANSCGGGDALREKDVGHGEASASLA